MTQQYLHTPIQVVKILTLQIVKINDGVVLNPRAYDGAVFEMIYGTDNFAFRQNRIHGGQPITQFYSPTEVCTFHGECQIPNMCNKTYVDILTADIYNDTYIKTEMASLISNIYLNNYYIKAEIDSLFPNTGLSNYYTKSEVDDIDNELFTLKSIFYNKTEIGTQLTYFATISYLQGNYMTTLSITEAVMNNSASITLLADSFLW